MPEGRYGDGKIGFRGQKDKKTFCGSRGCKDRSSVAAFNYYILILNK